MSMAVRRVFLLQSNLQFPVSTIILLETISIFAKKHFPFYLLHIFFQNTLSPEKTFFMDTKKPFTFFMVKKRKV